MYGGRYCDTCKAWGDHHTDRHNLMMGIKDNDLVIVQFNGKSIRRSEVAAYLPQPKRGILSRIKTLLSN